MSIRSETRARGGCAVGLVVLSLLALACESAIDPAMVEAEVVAFGQYTLGGGRPELVTPGPSIPCRLGQVFGVDYRISTRDGSTGPVPVELRWTHPVLDVPDWRPSKTETPVDQALPVIERGESEVLGRSLWRLEEAKDLVPGRYAFEIRARETDMRLLHRAFDVDGCPEGE